MIKTVNDDQHQIIRDIIQLHCPMGIDLDPTYSKGVFYNGSGIDQPRHKSDLYPHPKTSGVIKADAKDLPFSDDSLQSIMFDPPFLAGYTKAKPTGKMGERFHGFPYVTDLWAWYDECIAEFARILQKKGVLIFKCQDTVSSGKQWITHHHVITEAEKQGFYTKDVFILTAKNRMIGHNHKNQKHARKFHSYFIVFTKK